MLSADTGYFSGENLAELESRNIDGYIPDRATETQKAANPYAKGHFRYDAEHDTYTCPTGKRLALWSTGKDRKGNPLRIYANMSACVQCPVRHQCTSTKFRRISANQHEIQREAMRQKMQSPRGKEQSVKRKSSVEPVWGLIKHILGYSRVSLRGITQVTNEFRLIGTAVNLRKLHALLRRRPELGSVLLEWNPTAQAAQ